jgi:ectoine hydroxylase-related dioxygenase (phytanoyl-CoA dioxygenase family)
VTPTPGQAEAAIRKHGLVRWDRFVTGDHLDRLRTAAAALVASEHCEVQSRSLRVWNLFSHGVEFTRLLSEPRLRTLCTGLLGDGYILSDYSINAVHQGAVQDPWHVDYPYNEMPRPVASPDPLGLQCVLALDRFHRDNGATQYVRRSHRRELPGVVETGRELVERFEAQPGDLMVMHAATWHRAGLNTTPDGRTALVLSFVQRWVRPIVAPRDVAGAVHDAMSDELLVVLGAVVHETVDSRVVRREVV